jgi:hypothetical protein
LPRALGDAKSAEAWIDWDAAYGPPMKPRVAPPHGIPLVEIGAGANDGLDRSRNGREGSRDGREGSRGLDRPRSARPVLRAVQDAPAIPESDPPAIRGSGGGRSAHGASNVPRVIPGRRTVTIRGQLAARPAPRRPGRSPYERGGSRPDRIAMWAVLLGVLLILVAATSSRAAGRAHVARAETRAVAATVVAHRGTVVAHRARVRVRPTR